MDYEVGFHRFSSRPDREIVKITSDSKGFKLYWGMREESFAKEFRNFVNSYLNSKIETKMDKIYQRENDENKNRK